MLSILIPTYNYDCAFLVAELKKQADSLKITYEIIVQDDCSTQFIEENSKIGLLQYCIFTRNTSNLGRTQTRNLLSQKAKFDWLLFLDSDVIPTHENFIKNYINYLQTENSVVIGGIDYKDETVCSSKILRYKFGKEREVVAIDKRQKNPFSYVLSGNILIKKSIFDRFNFSENSNLYGLDIYFAYQLFLNKILIIHIENPVYHLGIEENEVFFKKSLDAVNTRKNHLADLKHIEKVNSLLKHYNFLKKYKLDGLTYQLFLKTESYLRSKIICKNPNLFLFDLYRLGYICNPKV